MRATTSGLVSDHIKNAANYTGHGCEQNGGSEKKVPLLTERLMGKKVLLDDLG
jgi:hypothetical protein